MAMRPEQVIRIGGEEGATPAEMLTLWDLESSQGTNKAARNDFQITRTAFKEVMPEGDITNPEDVTRAAARYFVKQKIAQGGNSFAAFAGYNGGPSWQQTMQDPAALERHKSLNAGSTPVDYASNAETVRRRYEQQYPSSGASGEGIVANADIRTIPPGTLEPVRFEKSEQFQPTRQSTADILANLFTDISSTVAESKAQYAAFAEQANSLTADFGTKAAAVASAFEQAGIAKATEVLAKQTVDKTMASNAARTLSDANVNTSDVNSQLAHNLREMAGFQRQAEEYRARIQSNSVDFLEDPVKWVQNLIDMPPLVRRHNQAITDYNITKEQTDGLIATAHNANVANNATRATIADSEAQATANLATAAANVESRKADLSASDTNWQHFMVQQQRTTQQIHAMTVGAEALMKSVEQGVRDEGLRQKAAADALSLKQLQDTAIVAGITGINSLEDYKRLPRSQQQVLAYLMQSGTFGEDQVSAYKGVQQGDVSKMPSTTRSLMSFEQMLYRTATESSNSVQNRGMNTAERLIHENTTMQDTARKWHNDTGLSMSNVPNPYAAPPADSMTKIPEVQRLQLGKLIDEGMKTHPGVPMTDQQIWAIVDQGLRSGTSYTDIQVAANDLVQYYRQVVKVNNTAHNFQAFKIDGQTNYNFSPDGKGQPIDATNYTQVITRLRRGKESGWRTAPEDIFPFLTGFSQQ